MLAVKDDAGVETVLGAGGGGGGALLAIHTYTGGSDNFVSMSSSTAADIDATNAAVTFTAPASGNVLVMVGLSLQSSGGGHGRIGLREGTTNIYAPWNVNVGVTSPVFLVAQFYLTGVSAGSHTYKASWNTDGTIYVFTGPTYGPYVLEVYAAP